jgi:hypothetical protein
MALPKEQIASIISQLNSFGDDGVAFDNWMFTIANYVRSHGDVGAFKSTARSLWLSNNKRGVEQLVRETLGGLTTEERAIVKQGDLTEPMAEAAFYKLLCKMGLCKGDTLTVHSADGDIVPLKFDDDRLPVRPKKVTAPKPPSGRTSASVPNLAQEPKTLEQAKVEAKETAPPKIIKTTEKALVSKPKKPKKARAPRKKKPKNDDS